MQNERIWIELTESCIDQEGLREKVAHRDVGAHGWFVGVTRMTTGNRVTDTLAYEAHAPMAIRQLEMLADAAVEKFSLRRLVIVHRLGEVPVGEASIVVGCSSSHRPETFQALAWIMDTLKREIPIWKREVYADGTTEWVHPTGPQDQNQPGRTVVQDQNQPGRTVVQDQSHSDPNRSGETRSTHE